MVKAAEREPRTQSTVWYLCLPIFEKYKIKLPTRDYFASRIKAVCEKLGFTREELGIIAKPRANMYFNGEWSSVSYDAIDALAENGTDIIFIEKKGVVEVICKYADKIGIALVDTQGFFTDYGRDLVEAGQASGANVTVVSDYDASGIKLAHDAGDIPRLGVDQEMLDYFGLDRENPTISVPMRAAKDVITPIMGLVSSDELEFLRDKKVEIDAVLAAVGNERFWEYLIYKLEEYYPTRDYTRVITPEPTTSKYYPRILNELQDVITAYIKLILKDEASEVKEELQEVEGFIEDIKKKRKEIDERYQAIVDKDEKLKQIGKKLATEIQPLIEQLKKLTEEKEKERAKGGKDSGQN
jgi:transcriptional regulator with XRE-family HTH domain